MARNLRFHLPGVLQRPVQSGNNREPCFFGDEDSPKVRRRVCSRRSQWFIKACYLAVPLLLLVACGNTSNESGNNGGSEEVTVAFANATGGGNADGTRDNPMALAEALASADVVVLLSNAGDITGHFSLSSGQWLVAGGDSGAISLVLSSGEELNISDLGPRPTIVGQDQPPLLTSTLTLSTNNRVQGVAIVGIDNAIHSQVYTASSPILRDLRISGTRFHAIDLSSHSNVTIDNVTIVDSGLDAIVITLSENVVISNTSVSGTSTSSGGIEVSNSGSVELRDVSVNNTRGLEVWAFTANSSATLQDVTVTQGAGVSVASGTVQLANVTTEDTVSTGVWVDAINAQLDNVNVLNISDPNATGIRVGNIWSTGNGAVTISNSSVSNVEEGFAIVPSIYSMALSGTGNTTSNVAAPCVVNLSSVTGSMQLNAGSCP